MNINAYIHADGATGWDEIEEIISAREAITDEVVEVFVRNGLTVATARDVFDRAEAKLEMLINDFPVAQLCTRPTSPTGSQKP